MFGWIPIIGPIVQGLFGFLNKKQEVDLEKFKESNKFDIESMKASVAILEGQKDDVTIRLFRDILIAPWAVYGGLAGWDWTVALKYPNLVWGLAPVKGPLEYLPYMVFVYLLGAVGLNIWRRR